jgi:hypothetical protein
LRPKNNDAAAEENESVWSDVLAPRMRKEQQERRRCDSKNKIEIDGPHQLGPMTHTETGEGNEQVKGTSAAAEAGNDEGRSRRNCKQNNG